MFVLKKQSLVVSKVEENDIFDILQYANMENYLKFKLRALDG